MALRRPERTFSHSEWVRRRIAQAFSITVDVYTHVLVDGGEVDYHALAMAG